MSTEINEIKSCIDDNESIEVAIGTAGIRLFSITNKIWLDEDGVNKLIESLEIAKSMKGYE